MNRQKLAEIKYDLQGQLKMKLHELEVHSKEKGGVSDAFLSGYTLAIKDYSENFGTNNLTIQRNGHKIQGAASNMTVSTNLA